MGISLLAGLGAAAAGWAKGRSINQDDQRRDAELQMRTQEHDLRMRDAQRAESDRQGLAQALRPIQMEQGAGGAVKPDTMDNRDVGLPENASLANGGLMPGGFKVGAQSFPDQGQADQALSLANSPEARTKRVVDTLQSQGKPLEAMDFEGKAQDHADRHWNGMIRDALVRGHEGLADVMSKSEAGPFRGKKVKAVVSDDGKNVNYAIQNPDGTVTPTGYTFANDQNGIITAGYKLANIDPQVRYRNMVDEDRKGAELSRKDRELALKERELDEVKAPLAEARGAAAEALATARERGRGGDSADRESRLRWTSLHGESGRRLSEANKALAKLTGDALFMSKATKNPDSQQAQILAGAKADVEQYKGDRDLYGKLLGGSVGDQARAAAGTPAPAPRGGAAAPGARPPATAPAAAGQGARPASKAEYDALPPGTRYFHPQRQQWLVKQ